MSADSTFRLTDEELEVARKAVEDVLISMRDARIALVGRPNGLVCREKDGSDSYLIRVTIADAFRIGLEAVEKHRNDSKTEK